MFHDLSKGVCTISGYQVRLTFFIQRWARTIAIDSFPIDALQSGFFHRVSVLVLHSECSSLRHCTGLVYHFNEGSGQNKNERKLVRSLS